MSEIDHNNNAEPSPRPARSRFNFNNARFDTTPPAPEIEQRPRRERLRRVHLEEKSGPLIFNVAQLLRDHEGATRDYEYAQDHLHLNDPVEDVVDATDATDLRGRVRLTRVRHDVLAQGPGQAEVVLNCVRCLNDYQQHVDYEVEDLFRPSIDVETGLPVSPELPEEEADLKIDANHLIDLGEAIRQQILVSLPMQPLCGEDCPGLYEYLDEINRDSDEAEDEPDADHPIPADPRWSALSKLKLDE